MIPPQIAGQVFLQELNPLIVMFYTSSTPKNTAILGKALISNLQDILTESNMKTVNN